MVKKRANICLVSRMVRNAGWFVDKLCEVVDGESLLLYPLRISVRGVLMPVSIMDKLILLETEI